MSNKKRLREETPSPHIQQTVHLFLQHMERLRPFAAGLQAYGRQHHQWVRDAQQIAHTILNTHTVSDYQECGDFYNSVYHLTLVDPTDDPRTSRLQYVFRLLKK